MEEELPGGQWERIHLPVQELIEPWVQPLGGADPLGEEMATHCSPLAWEIPWTEEPGGLQSMGLRRVGHDQVTEYTRMGMYYAHCFLLLPYS